MTTPTNKTYKKLPGAVEGAFVVLLGQNALLFSKPIRSVVEDATLSGVHVVVGVIAVVSFFNVAANWVSSREINHDPVDYKSSHLFWDIAILGVLFTTTQALLELCGDKFTISLDTALAVTAAFYIPLCSIYVLWNRIEIRERERRTANGLPARGVHVMKVANVTNVINIIIAAFMLILACVTQSVSALYVFFGLWTCVWLYVMFIFVTDNTLVNVRGDKAEAMAGGTG